MLGHISHAVQTDPGLVISLDLLLGLALKVLLVRLESVPGSVQRRVVPHLRVEVGCNIAIEGNMTHPVAVRTCMGTPLGDNVLESLHNGNSRAASSRPNAESVVEGESACRQIGPTTSCRLLCLLLGLIDLLLERLNLGLGLLERVLDSLALDLGLLELVLEVANLGILGGYLGLSLD